MSVFNIFVSSPGDVMVERRRVENIASRLNGEFEGRARLVTVRWENELYQAYSTFQTQIPRSTECDLVIGILKWRLGTELPPNFNEKLPDGRPYPSGTAFEILTAIEKRQKGAERPDIYLFRFTASSPSVNVEDPNRERIEHDWEVLKGFFQEWFINEKGQFKAAFNPYTSEDHFEMQLEHMLRKWVADKVAGGRMARWPIAVKGSPFCGLAAFGTKHAPVFFGRTQDINRAVDLWREAGARRSPFLLVVGASGVGKSSLARAGLLPRFTTPGVIKEVNVWRIAVMRPGDSEGGPFAAVAAALMQGAADLSTEEENRGAALPEIAQGDSRTPAELAAILRRTDATAVKPIVNALSRVAENERDRERYHRDVRCDLVLLVDQLDELFAASVNEDERTHFIDLVKALMATGRVWIVMTLRADLYARMLDQPGLKKLKEDGATYDLAPPGAIELGEIVRGPAEAAGFAYETNTVTGESLDTQLLREAERPGMLPLLQLALSRLFEGREEANDEINLPLKVYEKLGGLKGIIEEAGETALDALAEAEKARLARLLRQLAIFAHDRDGTAQGRGDISTLTIRAVPLSEAATDPATRKLIDALVEARLLTIGGTNAEPQLRLAHQRVIEDWTRARSTVADNADFYRIRADVDESRRKWEVGNRRGELLLPRGLPLAQAESIVDKYADELPPETRAYVKMSRTRANRGQMLGWSAALVFALVAISASALGIVAYRSERRAELERARAEVNLTQAERERARAELNLAKADQERQKAEQSLTERNEERSRKLVTQSRFLNDMAIQRSNSGYAATALLLALEALPDITGVERPYVPESEELLFALQQRMQEIAVLDGHDRKEWSSSFDSSFDDRDTASGRWAFIWDAESGREVAVLKGGHADDVTSAAFSPDGRRIVTASHDKTACIWDARAGKTIAVLVGHTDRVRTAAFSPDGLRIVTASDDQTARIWNAESGRQVTVLSSASGSAVFSPDGRTILTTGERGARIWAAENGKLISVLNTGDDLLESAAFSPDGQRVVTVFFDDKLGRIWDAQSGRVITILKGHESAINSAAFSPDGRRVVTASKDKSARIWDVVTGKSVTLLAGHAQEVKSATFSSDGRRIVTASEDHTARIWGVEGGQELAVLRDLYLGNRAIFGSDNRRIVISNTFGITRDPSFSSDGRLLVTIGSNDATVWNVENSEEIAVLGNLAEALGYTLVSRDASRVLTVSQEGRARIWNAETKETVSVLSEQIWAVTSAGFSPDGRLLVTTSKEKTARLWDTATGKINAILDGHADIINSAAFSFDGRRVVTASTDRTVRIWEGETGKTIAILSGHLKAVNSASFSFDGRRIVTASEDGTARIWDVEGGKEIATFEKEKYRVLDVALSSNGRRLVTLSQGGFAQTASLWDLDTNKKIGSYGSREDDASSVTFSPTGRFLLIGGGGYATLANGETGEEVSRFVVHGEVLSALFSPDEKRVMIMSGGAAASIWDIEASATVAVLNGEVTNAAFSENAMRLVTLSPKTVRIWRIFPTTRVLTDHAMKVAPRCLTQQERKEAFLDPDPPPWCVEMEKWPYATQDWKDWFEYRKRNNHPPLADNWAWKDWLTARHADCDQKVEADPRISGCTRLIQDQTEPTRFRAIGFINRGDAYNMRGDNDRAIADYTEAIFLNGNLAYPYKARGYILFEKGDFQGAAADMFQRLKLREDDTYAILFRFLAQARGGVTSTSELEAHSARLETRAWPYPVIDMYLDRRSIQEVLTNASNSDERCEAYFYIGERHILHGDRSEAVKELKLAAENCPTTFIEYKAAHAELARLEALP